jgi:hypothetical protein
VIERAGSCIGGPDHNTELLVDDHSDGAYAAMRFDADCGSRVPASLEVAHKLFTNLFRQTAAWYGCLGCKRGSRA